MRNVEIKPFTTTTTGTNRQPTLYVQNGVLKNEIQILSFVMKPSVNRSCSELYSRENCGKKIIQSVTRSWIFQFECKHLNVTKN